MSKPSPQDTAKRLLILKYQVVHSFVLPPQEIIQDLFSEWSKDEQRQFVKGFKERSEQVVASMKYHGLWALMTDEEKGFLQSFPPNVNRQQHVNAMWCLESVVVLMWSMGMIREFPPFDTQSNGELLKRIPHENLDTFIRCAKLLPENEIEDKRSLAELWHWRGNTRRVIEMKLAPSPNSGLASFDEIIQKASHAALKHGDLSQVIDNDFPAKGKAYRDLSDLEWSEVRSITVERHHALNWLCGYAEDNQWDKTPMDT